MSFYYLLCFLFNKIREDGRTGSAGNRGWGGGGKVAQTMYTHVNKRKNGKTKGEKNKNKLVR
jgi:hypothetical protein